MSSLTQTSRTLQTYWKTVVAELEATPDQATAGLDTAMTACGFTGPAPRFIRFEWLLLIPTHYEWLGEVWAENGVTCLSVRFGLATGWAYYLTLAVMWGPTIFLVIAASEYPAWMPAILTLTGILFALPVAHGIAVRLRARAMENRLWRELAPLGPWTSGRTIKRTLNLAYGADYTVEHRQPGPRP